MELREPGVRRARRPLPQRTPPLNDPLRLQTTSNLPGDTPLASRGVARHARTTSTPRRRSFPNLPGEAANPSSPDPYSYPTGEVRRGAGREGFVRDSGVGRVSGWQDDSGVRERYRGGGGEGMESARGHESSRASGGASDASPTSSGGSSRRGIGARGCPPRSPRQQRLDLASPTRGQTHEDSSSPKSRSSGIGAGLGEEEPRQGGKGSPQPPEFVLHVDQVLRWLGVEGVTPEVLRRAKRGLREEHVAAKIWRALLRVCLLHLDASSEGQAGNDPAGGAQDAAPRTVVSSTPASRTLSGERGSRSARGFNAASSGGCNGRRGAKACAGGAGVVEVPLSVAVETCGHLLSLWGYRRRAFAEAVRAGDTLETREILLALAWVMTEARVFHAFEQAHLVSPLPPPRSSPPARSPQRDGKPGRGRQSCRSTPHAAPPPSQGRTDADAGKVPLNSVVLSPPPRFPRDVSETPEIAELAEEAFWKYLSDVEGGGEATRWPRGEEGGGELAKALRAAREMMCCYGRLGGELRIVEGLEASRGKMLSRMRSLHEEVQLQRRRVDSPSTAPTVKSLAASSSPQRHNRHYHHHQDHEAAKPSGSNTSRADPYFLCLLAKPEEERHRVFSNVSKAREALERAERGRSHTGRWCRWVSSAVVESTSTSTSHPNKGTLPQVTPSIGQRAGGSAMANPPERAGGRDGDKDEAFASPGVGDGEPLAVGVRPAPLARVELLQRQLESRIREFPTPSPILASVWQSAVSRYAENPRNDRSSTAAEKTRMTRFARARVADLPPGQMPAREEDGLDSESVEGVLRRLAEGVDSRLGQQEFVRALEEGWQPCGPTPDGRQILPELDDSTAFLGVEKSDRGRAGSSRVSEGARNPPAPVLSACSTSVVRRELQEARLLHAEILAELLASCREVMPFHPRETGCRKPS